MRLIAGKRGLAALCATALALVLACTVAVPRAWADDDADDGQSTAHNQVYVNQLADSSFLYETSIADLAEADSYYEGQTVMVKGEVVGDQVNDENDPNLCWITLQDKEEIRSVVAVLMTKDQAKSIDTFGAYGRTGTTMQVRGIFHLECDDHQGMSDIHAEEVSAIAQGQTDDDEINPRLLSFGVLSVAVGLILFGVYHYRREKML